MMTSVLARAAERLFDVEALARYFQSRQNSDGGFCFYGLDESNLSDTCYAVLSLQIIGRKPDNPRVAGFLRPLPERERRLPPGAGVGHLRVRDVILCHGIVEGAA